MIARCDIRPVIGSETESVLGVYRQCEGFLALGPVPQASMEMVRADFGHSLQAGGVFCGIHDAQGAMIGVVDFIPSGFEGEPSHAFISLLMIVPTARRRGFGAETVGIIENRILHNPAIEVIFSAV